jgi:hypothetical protein
MYGCVGVVNQYRFGCRLLAGNSKGDAFEVSLQLRVLAGMLKAARGLRLTRDETNKVKRQDKPAIEEEVHNIAEKTKRRTREHRDFVPDRSSRRPKPNDEGGLDKCRIT